MEGAIARFQSSLQRISDAIKERNALVEFPYTYLLPERVPNSIAIWKQDEDNFLVNLLVNQRLSEGMCSETHEGSSSGMFHVEV